MRFAFDAEQLQFRDALRDLLDKECTPEAVRATWELPTGHSRQRWAALAQMGAVGCTIDEAHGGLGLDETWLVLLLEEAGRHALPEPLGIATAVAAPLLRGAARDSDLLGRIADGSLVPAVQVPGRRYVEAAEAAEVLLLHDGDVVHAVAREDVTLTRQPAVDPGRRLYSVEWTPSSGTELSSSAADAKAAAADGALLSDAAQLLGVASVLIEMATEYAKQREQFGTVIGSFQAVKHHLATALVDVEFARPLVYRAAWSVATSQPARSADVAMAYDAIRAAATVAARASLQVHGAIGYTWEHDLHLWLNRAILPV